MIHSTQAKERGEMVEVAVPMSSLVPDCIADAGQVRQGGLHNLLPWIEKIFGGAG